MFETGHEVDGLHVVVLGRVRVSAVTEDGQEYTLNTIGPGEPFPLPLFFGMSSPALRYSADTSVKTAWRARPEVDEYLHAHPEVLYQMMRLIFMVLYGRINTLARGTAEEKVVKRLIELSERFGTAGEDEFEITTTQQELADSISLSRESVNLVLKKLEAKRVLTMSRNKIFMSITKAKAELCSKMSI